VITDLGYNAAFLISIGLAIPGHTPDLDLPAAHARAVWAGPGPEQGGQRAAGACRGHRAADRGPV